MWRAKCWVAPAASHSDLIADANVERLIGTISTSQKGSLSGEIIFLAELKSSDEIFIEH